MKKMLLMCFAAVIAVCAQAVSINWSAKGDTAWSSNVVTGAVVAYAPSVDGVAADLDTIVSVAKNGGVSGDYSAIEAALGDRQAPLGIARNDAQGFLGNVVIEGITKAELSGSYFIVVFDKDDNYAVAQIPGSASEWTDVAPSKDIPAYQAEFSGTMTVPEPTALALLALGIAGLALRRRA